VGLPRPPATAGPLSAEARAVSWGPFDEEVAAEFERVLGDAERLGMDVILDLHNNYGSYYVADETTGDGVGCCWGRNSTPDC
jgi:hypothetical protein